MQYNANKYVRASEISSFYLCPRLVYFQRRHAHATTDAVVRTGFFKSLSYYLPVVVQSPCPGAELEKAIDHACADSLLVYGSIYEQAITGAGQEARGMANDIIVGLMSEKERYGENGLSSLLSPASISMAAYSDKLRMSGNIDKVVFKGGIPGPVIISASKPPVVGVYASDRIRLAAYSLLLSEKYDVPCHEGAIEYVPGWCLRWAEIRYEDKRKALYARNRVLEMGRGNMPDALRGKWCARCGHYDACNVKASLLGKLFK
jgi:CRISPR-associated exonuclease Cas4